MDNRAIAAERFIDERQYEARRAVALARLQREALEGTAAPGERRTGLHRFLDAFRRVVAPTRAQESRRMPAA